MQTRNARLKNRSPRGADQQCWRLPEWVRTRSPRFNPSVYVGGDVILSKTIDGSIIYLDGRDTSLTPKICLTGDWETKTRKLLQRVLRRGDRFVDIGANCGFFFTDCSALRG